MKDNIILIGMPGAGKSTVGVILAKTLGLGFVDTDLLICRQTGMPLQDYINTQGIERFLQAEEHAALMLECERTVIATGGSMVYSADAMAHLQSGGRTVFINVGLDELLKRLKNITTRGIAVAPGRTMADVYSERLPLYEEYADITVTYDPSGRGDTEAMVDAVVRALKALE